MTEFARTVIRNDDKALYLKIGVILSVYLVSIVILSYFSSGEIVRWDRMSLVKVIETRGVNKLNGAKGLAIDKNGNLYVADSRNNRVLMISPNGSVRREFSSPTSSLSNPEDNPILNATSIAVHSDNIYISSYGIGKVLVYNSKGKLRNVLPKEEDKANLPDIFPLTMTVDSQGNLYAADGKKHQVVVFDSEGNLKLVFGSFGSGEGEFRYINGIAVDEDNGRIIVLDSGNLRIQFFNLDGKFLHQAVYLEKGENIMIAPRGLVYSHETGLLYVGEPVIDRVFALDDKGKILARSTEKGLNYPHGLSLGHDGLLYVTNRESGQIAVLNP